MVSLDLNVLRTIRGLRLASDRVFGRTVCVWHWRSFKLFYSILKPSGIRSLANVRQRSRINPCYPIRRCPSPVDWTSRLPIGSTMSILLRYTRIKRSTYPRYRSLSYSFTVNRTLVFVTHVVHYLAFSFHINLSRSNIWLPSWELLPQLSLPLVQDQVPTLFLFI